MDDKRIIEDEGLKFNLDGTGGFKADTGIPFLNHILEAFCRHGQFDLSISPSRFGRPKTTGAILSTTGGLLGEAFQRERDIYLKEPTSGHFVLPMDDVLVRVSLDLFGNKPVLNYKAKVRHPKVRSFDIQELESFFQAFTENSGCNLHIRLEYGEDPHHAAEAIFKCFARALDAATEIPI